MLRRLPNPQLESYILAAGWNDKQIHKLVSSIKKEPDQPVKEDDASFCRNLYHQFDHHKLNRGSDAMIIAIAEQWTTQGKVDGLPATPPAGVKVSPDEAAFLHRFYERRMEISALQEAILYTMNLDAYRKQHGRLPLKWDHAVPGGGKIELICEKEPILRLSDNRTSAERAGPGWLAVTPGQSFATAEFPLRPVAKTARVSRN
jgi:hypothetical protein